jgi:hypothetical protein
MPSLTRITTAHEADAHATRKLRTELLAEHYTAVRRLTSVNAKIIGTTP